MSDLHPDLSVIDQEDHVTIIEVRRGPDNFVDAEILKAIADAIDVLEQNIDCRVIVLVSEGKNFCAGVRLSADDRAIFEGEVNPIYVHAARMFTGSIPIVAAVQGAAIGAGLGLALVADFRVASMQTRFGATFARLGFHPGFGITETLPRIVGAQYALDMLYSGRRVTGTEAFAIGLCDRVVDGGADLVREEALQLARKIAGSAPLSLRSIRRAMRSPLGERVREAMAAEHLAQKQLSATVDYREGLAASAERREPRFIGV